MPFVELKTTRTGRPAKSNSVRMRTNKSVGQTQIVFSKDVFKKIGEPDYVNVFIGNEEDAGKIFISPAEKKNSASYKVIKPIRQVGFSMKAINAPLVEGTAEVKFEITGGGLLVDFRKEVPAPKSIPIKHLIHRSAMA